MNNKILFILSLFLFILSSCISTNLYEYEYSYLANDYDDLVHKIQNIELLNNDSIVEIELVNMNECEGYVIHYFIYVYYKSFESLYDDEKIVVDCENYYNLGVTFLFHSQTNNGDYAVRLDYKDSHIVNIDTLYDKLIITRFDEYMWPEQENGSFKSNCKFYNLPNEIKNCIENSLMNKEKVIIK